MRRVGQSVRVMLAAWCLMWGSFGVAHADEPLQVVLTSHKVLVDDDGAEQLIAGDEARPGEVLEYAAAYRNLSNRPLTDLLATLPIPAGTEFLANSAVPAPDAASIDGQTFYPFPLKRTVKQADGTEQEELVPASEYVALRWKIPTLTPRNTITVRARVRLATAAASEE